MVEGMSVVVNVMLSVMSPPPVLCNLSECTLVKLCTLGVFVSGIILHTIHKTVIFYWLPSHMGISGNERADSAVKVALLKDVSECLISYTDAYQYISQYVHDLWQREWDTAVNNKLHATKPSIGEQPSAYRSVRRDKVVLSRLKLGHSYLTHSYLLKGEPPPECVTCNCRLTISHILVDCIDYDIG